MVNWPDLVEQARPLRWLSTNQLPWREAVDVLLTHEKPRPAVDRSAVRGLREAVDEHRARGDWRVLVGTPELARAVVAHTPPADVVDHHQAHDWVHALLGDYERTRTGAKPKPQIEVTRGAIEAATRQRLGTG